MDEVVYVVDSSAIIGGYSPSIVRGKQYAPPTIFNELIDQRSRSVLEAAVKNGDLLIRAPSEGGIRMAEDVARKTGDTEVLSETDKQIVALAFDLADEGFTPIIVTDDYALQNVAHKAGFKFKTVLRSGIKNLVKWKLYCPSCKRNYSPSYPHDECEICGGRLKRSPSKRRSLHVED